jgi:hypothetical protein
MAEAFDTGVHTRVLWHPFERKLKRMTTVKKRTVVYLDEPERLALDRISARVGAPVGELIRRAVAAWLKKEKGVRK